MEAKTRIWNTPFKWSLGAYGALAAFALLVQYQFPESYAWVLGDVGYRGTGSAREWVSLPMLFGAAGFCFYLYWVWEGHRNRHLGFALWCFFLGFEECDWTQQIFGFASPDLFLKYNGEGAMNFHNFYVPIGPMVNALFFAPLLIYLLVCLKNAITKTDGLAINALTWWALVLCTEIFTTPENKGTLLQLTLYLFICIHVWQFFRQKTRWAV